MMKSRKNDPARLNQSMQMLAENNGIILLYHSVMENLPQALGRTVHNVKPDQFRQHLQQLSDYFEFVSLQEFSSATSKSGLACITFDDGYKNVIKNALPVLQAMNYPFTLFINPLTFEGSWNWRDKVRYLIHHQQVEAFTGTLNLGFKQGRFYRYSKHPENNSAVVDAALNAFLQGQMIDVYGDYPYLLSDELVSHPLISYGNHSQNHYVLASLDDSQQMQEISEAHENLGKLENLQLSSCFSAPFGGPDDVNLTTLELIKKMSYQSLLMSRQLLQPKHASIETIQILERFMPRSDNVISEIVNTAH